MQIINNILIFKAVGILLLHTLIPHGHHFEMAYEEHIKVHENADDIIDFLGLGFQQDSTNQLENFTPHGQNLLKQIDFIDFNFLTSVLFVKDESTLRSGGLYFKTQPQNLFNTFLLPSNSLRAPPDSDFYA